MPYIVSLLKKAIIITKIPPMKFAQLLIIPVTTVTTIVAPSLFCENSLHSGIQELTKPLQDGRNCFGQLQVLVTGGLYESQSVKITEIFCNCSHWLLHKSFLSISHSSVDGVSMMSSHERYVALQKKASALLAQS